MKSALRVVGYSISLCAIGYFAFAVIEIAKSEGTAALVEQWSPTAILAAALCYFFIIPVTAWAWARLLASMQVQQPTLALNHILGVSQIAKYLPGNVAQHAGRFIFSKKRNIPAGACGITIMVETLLAIAASALVGATAMLVVYGTEAHGQSVQSSLLLTASGMLVACALGLAITQRYAAPLVTKLFPEAAAQIAILPGKRAMGWAFCAYSLNYLLVGVGLFGIAAAMTGLPSPALLYFCVATFALSWLAGFLAPGAPAGLGVREGAMLALLKPVLDESVALSTILAFRVATTAGDLFSFLWGLCADRMLLMRAQRS